jgi:hypothetical protein
VVTGHQPLLYHPGVWAKVFLADRVARQLGGTAIECVVDTDGFDALATAVPCAPEPCRRVVTLAEAEHESGYFAASPPPAPDAIDRLRREAPEALAGLGLEEQAKRAVAFADALADASQDASDLAEAVTAARRAFERPAGLRYRSLSILREVRTFGFRRFVTELALRAHEFASTHNEVLAAYRQARGLRSEARPFPDLVVEGDSAELPLWYLDGSTRRAVSAVPDGAGVAIAAGDTRVTRVTSDGTLEEFDGDLAPRAVALTLFNRIAFADLFVHGAGGAAYDAVTDEIVRGFWGVEPPRYVAATLTLRLPLDVPDDIQDDLAELRQRLHRLEHNPDQLLDDATLDPDVADRAGEAARRKAELVEAIQAPDAEKKRLGALIGEVNADLASIMEPVAQRTRDGIASLEEQERRRAVLADRTYPFFLWDPADVATLLGA